MGTTLFAALIYLSFIILGFYIFYLIIKTAVKNGINESILHNQVPDSKANE